MAATVDLPTPPLPDATATIVATPGTAPRAGRAAAGPAGGGAPRARGGAVRARGGACAVSTAVTESTPGSASTAFSAALRNGSSRWPRSASTSIAKATLPSRITSPETIPSETISAPLSGSGTRASASRICRSVTMLIPFSSPGGSTARPLVAALGSERRLRQTERSRRPGRSARGFHRRGRAEAPPDTRDLGPATRIGNTRARLSVASSALHNGHRPIGGGPRKGLKLECFGKVRAVAHGAAGRAAAAPGAATAAVARPVRAGAARNRPTSRSCCGAARTAFGGCCRAVSGPAPGSPSFARDRRHLAGERLLPRAARRGRRGAALRRLQSHDPAGPQLSPARCRSNWC